MNQVVGGAEWTDSDYEVENVILLMQYAQESLKCTDGVRRQIILSQFGSRFVRLRSEPLLP